MCELVKGSKISVTLLRIFLKLWDNEEETISRIVTESFFPRAPGVKTGKDFAANLSMDPR